MSLRSFESKRRTGFLARGSLTQGIEAEGLEVLFISQSFWPCLCHIKLTYLPQARMR